MFSRPFIDYKIKKTGEPAVLGRFFIVSNYNVKIYVPSWVIDRLPSNIILEEEDQHSLRSFLTVTNDFTKERYISKLSEIKHRKDKH